MEQEGIVSIWAGKFDSEDDFYAFMKEDYDDEDNAQSPFGEHIGADYVDPDGMEIQYFEDAITPHDMEQLSYAENFAGQIESKLFDGYNAVIALFDYHHQPNSGNTLPLRFIGSYRYS